MTTVLAAHAWAEEICFALADVNKNLAKTYGETPVVYGVVEGGKARLIVWANAESGTWTMAALGTDGKVCIFSSGYGWELVKQKPEGHDS